jgi:hypothetical protein
MPNGVRRERHAMALVSSAGTAGEMTVDLRDSCSRQRQDRTLRFFSVPVVISHDAELDRRLDVEQMDAIRAKPLE